MQFRQPINMNDLQYNILGLDGVIGVKELRLFQSGAELGEDASVDRNLYRLDNDGTVINNIPGYGFQYSFGSSEDGGSLSSEGLIIPSVTPAVFELRNPNRDIYGRVI